MDIIPEEVELVILREKASRLASKDSIATLERAFVDLYFETTRELIPFSVQELAHIFVNMRAALSINNAAMVRYAHERTISREIRDIVDFPKTRPLMQRNAASSVFLRTLEASV